MEGLPFEFPSGFNLSDPRPGTIGRYYTPYGEAATHWDNMLVYRLESEAVAHGGPAYVLYVSADDTTRWWFVDRSTDKVEGCFPLTAGTREEVLAAVIAAMFKSGKAPQGGTI